MNMQWAFDRVLCLESGKESNGRNKFTDFAAGPTNVPYYYLYILKSIFQTFMIIFIAYIQ